MASSVAANGRPSSSRSGARRGLKVRNGIDPVAKKHPAARVDKSVSRKSAILIQSRERSATTASGTARSQVPALSRLRKGVYP